MWHFIQRFRLTALALTCLAFLSLVALVASAQVTLIVYKIALVTVAGLAGLVLDRLLFPYARPDGYLKAGSWHALQKYFTDRGIDEKANFEIADGYHTAFIAACFRRVCLIALCVVGMSLGL